MQLKKTARITGALYLLVIICAGFAEGYARGSLIVPGDAAATATNIMESEGLFRLGFASDLVAFLTDAIIAILFYFLLKPVNNMLAIVMSALRLLAHPAIASVNMLNHYAVLLLLGDAEYLTSFDPEQIQGFIIHFIYLHHIGYLVAGVFFGAHLLVLGYLLYRSPLFPKIIGILLGLAAGGYLLESFGNFLFPGNEEILLWIVSVSAVIGEVSLTLWLLIKGVKHPERQT